jgi:TolB-like protein/Flp pilus assembly protein TadD
MSAPPAPDSRIAIAVLPFATPSSGEGDDWLGTGLAEAVADRLAGVRALHVLPFASSVALSGGPQGPADVGQRLGAAVVLAGTVARSGGRLRLTADLLDVTARATRWSDRFDRPDRDVWAVEAEIARAVLRTLGVTVTDEADRALDTAPTAVPRAYDAYLRGRWLARDLLRRQQDLARDLFTEAIVADAGFAAAHAALAICHAMLFQYWDSSDANVQAAEAASRRAVELSPDLAEAHLARGLALSHAKRYDEAEAELRRAAELHPDAFEPPYFLARTARARGAMAEAAASFERACALRPEDYSSLTLLASVYVSLGRIDDARSAQRRALDLAADHLERHPDDTRALYLGAVALSSTGETAKARQWAKRAVAMEPDDSAVLYNVACVYSLLGLADSAIDCLEQAVANGFGHWDWLVHDSDLDPLRAHPRFTALLAGR